MWLWPQEHINYKCICTFSNSRFSQLQQLETSMKLIWIASYPGFGSWCQGDETVLQLLDGCPFTSQEFQVPTFKLYAYPGVSIFGLQTLRNAASSRFGFLWWIWSQKERRSVAYLYHIWQDPTHPKMWVSSRLVACEAFWVEWTRLLTDDSWMGLVPQLPQLFWKPQPGSWHDTTIHQYS